MFMHLESDVRSSFGRMSIKVTSHRKFKVTDRQGFLPELTVTDSVTLIGIVTQRSGIMLYALISILIFFWIVGFIANIGGPLIHTLLVLAVAIFLFDMITGRRAA